MKIRSTVKVLYPSVGYSTDRSKAVVLVFLCLCVTFYSDAFCAVILCFLFPHFFQSYLAY